MDENLSQEGDDGRPVGGWLRTVVRLGKAYIWFYAALSVFAIVMMIYDYLTE